jgi:hypothetical protein
VEREDGVVFGMCIEQIRAGLIGFETEILADSMSTDNDSYI